jgi:hypothetical protein
MLQLRLAFLLAVLTFSGHSSAQGWFQYTSEMDQFTVNFPAEPEVEEISYPSEYGAVFPGRVYKALSGDNAYSVTVIDYRTQRTTIVKVAAKSPTMPGRI